MLRQIEPRLRRSNVVFNSFASCITNASEKFSRAPKMAMPEMVSKPRMFFQQTKSAVSFEQLQCFTDAHCSWKLNKQMDVINSNVKFIDLAFLPEGNLPDEEFTIHPQSIELERIHSILAFPHEVESILSEAMLPRFQIHFLSPKIAHTNFEFSSEVLESRPSDSSHLRILNFEGGNSSVGLKTEVPLPHM